MKQRPLWICPKCGKSFVTKNLWHSCNQYSVDDFFKNKSPQLKTLFTSYVKLIETVCGEVIVNFDKTRISFQARTRFAGIQGTTKDELICGFWLKHKIVSPRFTKVEFIPPNNYVYQFRIKRTSDLDGEVAGWIKEAYKIGQQKY